MGQRSSRTEGMYKGDGVRVEGGGNSAEGLGK